MPLNISNVVRKRLGELGKSPEDPATRQELYEGTLLRIKRAYPVDYYWLWAREGQTDATEFIADVRRALAAAEAKARMFEIFRTGAVPTKYLKPVAVNFFEPDDDMSDCHGHNAWALYNSFTRVLRDEPLHTRLAHTTALLRHFPVLAEMAETVDIEPTDEA